MDLSSPLDCKSLKTGIMFLKFTLSSLVLAMSLA